MRLPLAHHGRPSAPRPACHGSAAGSLSRSLLRRTPLGALLGLGLAACNSAPMIMPDLAVPRGALLVVDADRSGVADPASAADVAGRAAWTATAGAIFLANVDDDDADGFPDSADEVLSGPDDADDLARLVIAPFPEAGAGATATLTLAPDGAARLFKRDGVGAFSALAAGATLSAEEIAAGVELGIEGIDFPDAGWDGLITVTLTIDGAATAPGVPTTDTVTLRCAPLLLFPNTAPTESVMAASFGDNDSRPFISDLRAGLKPTGVPLDEIDPYDDRWVGRDGGDQWTQDILEVGWTAMPGPAGPRAMHVVIRTPPPDRTAGEYAAAALLGPGFGFVWKHSDPYNRGDEAASLDSFGNLDALPAYAHGGEKYPLGRVIYGNTAQRGVDPALRKFLGAQGAQGAPYTIDTAWLYVGHLDEFISFVPSTNKRGYALLVASPARARTVLEDLVKEDPASAAVKMFEMRAWVDFNTGKAIPAAISIAEVLADPDLTAANAAAQLKIDAERTKLQEEMGLDDTDIIEIPVIFDGVEGGNRTYYVAYSPGVVNLLVVDKVLLPPKTHGPVIDGADALARDAEAQLAPLGNTTAWVEDWNLYHRLDGEVHCGTNVVRKIPETMWWEVTP